MRKSILACAACLALLTTSCGVHSEATSNRNLTQTEVVLSRNNYKIVGMASGESCQNYILGIGGLSPKSLGESALSDMYRTAGLKGSQVIINTNVCYKKAIYLGVYIKAKAIATGTIIEFIDAPTDAKTDATDTNVQSNANPDIIALQEGTNTYTPSSSDEPISDQPEYYELTFYKKRKKATTWEIASQKTIYTTYKDAQTLAEMWDYNTTTSTQYMCGIKKVKP